MLVSAEEDVLTTAKLEACGAATFVRKQDFGPATLRALWARHGAPAQPAG